MTETELIAELTKYLVAVEARVVAAYDELDGDSPVKQELSAALTALETAHAVIESTYPGLICSCMYEVYPVAAHTN